MIVAFASNQVMFARGDGAGGTVETITTDPVPMNGMNLASAILNVHCYLDATTPVQNPQLTATAQVSNDGVNWVDTSVIVTATGTGTQPIKTDAAEGQFIRFKYEWSPDPGSAGSDLVFICFDLHVRLDHS